MVRKEFYRLRSAVQHYTWGKRKRGDDIPLIARLVGDVPHDDVPYAELWLGAHPKLPSTVHVGDRSIPLTEFIAASPAEVLGRGLVAAGVRSLPFLLKILSCEQALSIQAHPDLELAAILHREHPEHYPDANHKPEIAIALTELRALCGFRPPDDIRADIRRLAPLRELTGDIAAEDTAEDGLREAYSRVLRASDAEAARALDGLLGFGSDGTPSDEAFRLVAGDFPGDRGALSAYFLNSLSLHPGEAVFIGANVPHAYLRGDIVECMANSDNVVRAGLTSKYIDREVLLSMLHYRGDLPAVMAGVNGCPGERSYRPPVREFTVSILSGSEVRDMALTSNDMVSVLLVLEGEASFEAEGKPPVTAPAGSGWLWPAALEQATVRFRGKATKVVRATPNPGK